MRYVFDSNILTWGMGDLQYFRWPEVASTYPARWEDLQIRFMSIEQASEVSGSETEGNCSDERLGASNLNVPT